MFNTYYNIECKIEDMRLSRQQFESCLKNQKGFSKVQSDEGRIIFKKGNKEYFTVEKREEGLEISYIFTNAIEKSVDEIFKLIISFTKLISTDKKIKLYFDVTAQYKLKTSDDRIIRKASAFSLDFMKEMISIKETSIFCESSISILSTRIVLVVDSKPYALFIGATIDGFSTILNFFSDVNLQNDGEILDFKRTLVGIVISSNNEVKTKYESAFNKDRGESDD